MSEDYVGRHVRKSGRLSDRMAERREDKARAAGWLPKHRKPTLGDQIASVNERLAAFVAAWREGLSR